MAKRFDCPSDGCEFDEWAERESDILDTARSHMESDHDESPSDEELRESISVVPSPRRIKSSAQEVMDERRRRAGRRAAEDVVSDGMTVGLGTGSTAAWATVAIADRMDAEGLDIEGVATSLQSHELAVEAGVPLTTLDQVETVDAAIDGADQFTTDGPHVIKGGGGAHAREKVIDTKADRFVVVSSGDKETNPMDFPVPFSVLPDARTQAREWVRAEGGDPRIRYAERMDGPIFTANGNVILDCDFGDIDDPVGLAERLSAIPGGMDHGLFVDVVDDLYVGTDDGVETHEF